MEVSGFLVHDRTRGRVEILDVVILVMRELRQLLRADVVLPHVRRPIAIGEKIDRVGHPHRREVERSGRGQGIDRFGGDRIDRDRMRLAAAVVAPLHVPARRLLVREPRAIGRVRATESIGQRNALGYAAGRGDRPELLDADDGRVHRGIAERHPLAVRRPAARKVGSRMPRQPARLAAGRVDHVDVAVRAELHREGDLLAVGREMRVGLRAGEAREPACIAAVAIDHPDVARIRERDLRCAQRRLPEQARALGVHARRAAQRGENDDGVTHDDIEVRGGG